MKRSKSYNYHINKFNNSNANSKKVNQTYLDVENAVKPNFQTPQKENYLDYCMFITDHLSFWEIENVSYIHMYRLNIIFRDKVYSELLSSFLNDA